MKLDKQLAKGSHELILLKLLSRQDMYGYQLIQQMALLSEDVFCMSQGSLYPFLHALEDKGLITSYTQMENGRERRFYHLTHAGQGALREKEDQWGIYTRAMALNFRGCTRNEALGGTLCSRVCCRDSRPCVWTASEQRIGRPFRIAGF